MPRSKSKSRTKKPSKVATDGSSPFGPGCMVCITGMAGFLARNLAVYLVEHYPDVTVRGFDIVDPPFVCGFDILHHPRIAFQRGDLLNAEQMREMVRGCTTVFHPSSLYRRIGNKSVMESVNVQGTRNIIDACISESVPRLVYTSSHNVVFEGKVIDGGSEDAPFAKEWKAMDTYTRTKIAGERMVLTSNHRLCMDGKTMLHTSAIRPGGIYGPEEAYHIPRVLRAVELGVFKAKMGDGNELMDWSEVTNLALGHVLAAEHLPGAAAGQAYNITDDEPMNNFVFFEGILNGLGLGPMPTRYAPTFLIMFLGWFVYYLYYFLLAIGFSETGAVLRGIEHSPIVFLPMEVIKVTTLHWFSCEKAKRQLGYKPIYSTTQGIKRVVKHLKKK